ncbi:MAG TPA: subclass B3 metallo-beta-lactamase [Bryobacteraceae bacterium]|jgi:metallo-beta-lactamase class B|nr:subclass B3 metallo-beta-lactamase [Bryobacteraceae bacterium]
MRLYVPGALLACCCALLADFTLKWNQPIPPYRVISNIYYVGTNYLASFLIRTPQGDILINPDYEQSVPLIRASVEKLGFAFSDIKIVLISHAHDDHAAGCALAKKLTHAKLMVMQADVPEIEGGGAGDFQYNSRWPPAKVDRVLHDGDSVTLGGTTLVAHLTPGHTKGCTTWTTEVKDGSRTYHVVIVGSPNVNPGYKLIGNAKYPQIAADYEKTFSVLKSLRCDIFLGAHGVYYGMDDKLKKLRAGGPNPFIDPEGYQAYVSDREQAFRSELRAQQATK